MLTSLKSTIAWKVSKYGPISGPYFPVFGMNTGIHGLGITSYLDNFHAVNPCTLLNMY